MNFGNRSGEARALAKEATSLCGSSFLGLRLKGDWAKATPMFERAGLLYRQSKEYTQAQECWEKAAQGHIAQKSNWHAAKAMERAGEAARDGSNWTAVQSCFTRAAELYLEEGRASNAAEALVKAGKALEECDPAAASHVYSKAIEWVEDAGKDGTAADVYRNAVGHAVRSQRWPDAVAILVRFAASCLQINAVNTVCKSYLGAVVVWLHAGEANSAWATYQDALAVSEFNSSQEALAAEDLLNAYREADAEAIAAVIKRQHCFAHIEPPVARLAVKLPGNQDLQRMAGELGGGGVFAGDEVEEEDLT